MGLSVYAARVCFLRLAARPPRRTAMPSARAKITKAHYETLAAFRQALRRFLHFSHEAATAAGVPPQQHQALLALKGFPGREHASIGELAERLHLRHHSAVGLVDRLARRGWVRRTPAREDRRRVEVRLTASGEALVARLSAAHLRELRQLGPELRRLLEFVERS
jgi:DNA-binding MarR family transcriptional regulator